VLPSSVQAFPVVWRDAQLLTSLSQQAEEMQRQPYVVFVYLGAEILEGHALLSGLDQVLDLLKVAERKAPGSIHYEMQSSRDFPGGKRHGHGTGNSVMMPSPPGSTITRIFKPL
jgi:hypothetical protein